MVKKIEFNTSLIVRLFQQTLINIPIVIYANEFGNYREFVQKLHFFRKLNVKIFIDSSHKFNYTSLKIMSSLGIACGIVIRENITEWDDLNDLMHYQVFSRTKHAPIEPFQYVVTNYTPESLIDYNMVYFNNASRFLHINEKEQIALTAEALENGNFIAEGIESLQYISENEKYIDDINKGFSYLLKMNECSFCPHYRICLGKFSSRNEKDTTCKTFFKDLMDAADFYYLHEKNKNLVWQW